MKPKSCVAKIQISFERIGVGLERTNDPSFPKSTSKEFESDSNVSSVRDDKNGFIPERVAQCVSVALKPPRTHSLLPARNLDTNVRVHNDEKPNVIIEIESNDIPSLRAGINSYLQLADASYKCITGSAD